ncbi:Peptide P4 [Caenorhabditis elegans]|nr:Peptide P4 [Caenorhabditis elegans]CDK13438.1 Peptide P4 [Caenorhabditis elegans]|eukprot:NP_001293206.1 Peptide P4 [Caenorhabditis elegans]
MVAWQPMKRSMINEDSRAPLLHAIEARLAEVLRAGERLGVNPEEVLADLRARNQFQ